MAWGLLDAREFRALARVDRRDLGLAVVTVLVVVFIGLLAGVLATVVLSLFLVAAKAALPNRTFLVRIPGTDAFRGEESVESGVAEEGILAYRFDGPLFFANAELLAEDIERALAEPQPGTPIRWVVIDAEGITDMDTTGVDTLDDLAAGMEERGIRLVLARVKAPVRAYLARTGLERLGDDRIYIEVSDAVAAGRQAIGADDGSASEGRPGGVGGRDDGHRPPRPARGAAREGR